jgi:hypothetical protein
MHFWIGVKILGINTFCGFRIVMSNNYKSPFYSTEGQKCLQQIKYCRAMGFLKLKIGKLFFNKFNRSKWVLKNQEFMLADIRLKEYFFRRRASEIILTQETFSLGGWTFFFIKVFLRIVFSVHYLVNIFLRIRTQHVIQDFLRRH